MKNTIITAFFCVFSMAAITQNITTVYDDHFVGGITVDGDDVYFIAYTDSPNYTIYRIDATETNPTTTEIFVLNVNSILQPSDIVKKGNYLYMSSTGMIWPREQEVVRIDISQANPQLEIIAKVINPKGLAFRNDELYINSETKIYKLDTSQANPIPVEIVSDLNPGPFGTIGLCVVGDFLYATEETQIVKYDLNQPNPTKISVASGFMGLTGITASEDESSLYFVGTYYDPVYKLDIATETWSSIIPTGLMGNYDIAHHTDNYLFVSAYEGFELIKIDLNSLNVGDNLTTAPTVYPNPTSGLIYVEGLEKEERATVYNTLGQTLIKAHIHSQIDISNLNKGIYFLKIGDRLPTKIVKN